MRILFASLVILITSVSAQAHQTIEVIQSFSIATTAGMQNGAAYVTLENTGPTEAELAGVSGDVAEFVEIHTHIMDGELRRMVAAELPIVLAPGEQLTMMPGGIHIMFLGLKNPMNAGDQMEITLHFDGKHVRDLDVSVPVYSFEDAQAFLGDGGMMDMDHGSMDHSDHGDMTSDDHTGHNHGS